MTVELNQIVYETVVDDSRGLPAAKRMSDALKKTAAAHGQAEDAAAKQATGLKVLDEAVLKVNRAQTSAVTSLNRWKAAADPLEAANQRLARAERDLTRAVQQGVFSEREKIQVLDKLRARTLGANTAMVGTSSALQRAAQSAALISGPLGGVASRFSVLNSLISTSGLLLGALTLGLGALAFGLAKVTGIGSEFEKSQLQIAALLKTTGGASEKTGEDIEGLARRIGKSTLASRNDVRQAAAELLTFRNIAGDAFDQTLERAQDLASLGFGSIQTATVTLAKALEDPAANMTNLRRVGVSFSKNQEEVIKQMAATGRMAEAQAALLAILEKQIGGAATGQAGGLSGAVDTLTENLGIFFEQLSQKTGLLDNLTAGIKGTAGAVDDLNNSLTPEGRLSSIDAEIARRQAEIDRINEPQEFGFSLGNTNPGRQRIVGIESEINSLLIERQGLLDDLADKEEGDLIRLAVQRDKNAAIARKDFENIMANFDKRLAKSRLGEEAIARIEAGEKAVGQALLENKNLNEQQIAAIKRRAIEVHKIIKAEKEAADETEKAVLKIFKQVDRQREADAKRQISLEKYITGLEAAAKVEQLSGVEKQVQLATIEAQNKLIDAQGDKLRDLTAAERKRIENAVRTKNELEEQRKALEKQEKEIARSIERGTDRGTDRAADILFDGFQGKIKNIGDLLETTLLRAVADAAAQAVFRPIIQTVVTTAVGGFNSLSGASAPGGAGAGAGAGGVNASSIASIGAGLIGGFQSQALGSFLANGALEAGLSPATAGFLGNAGLNLGFGAFGGLAANLVGLGSGNALIDAGLGTAGAFVGGGIGASIAALGAAGGPIGAAIGAFIGVAAGTLFKKKSSVGPYSQGFIGQDASGNFNVGGVGVDNGADRAAAQQLTDATADFLNALNSTDDISIGPFPSSFRVDTIAGQVITFLSSGGGRQADVPVGGSFLAQGSNTESVLIKTVQQLVARGFAQVESPEVLAAIKNSAAKTLEEFASDLDFASAIAGIDFNPEKLTQAEQALKAINEQFDAAADRAQALGIAEGSLIRARDEAIAGLTAGFDTAIEDQILAITDPFALVERELDRVQENRLKEAEALGADILEVERFNGLERQKIIEQFGRAANNTLQTLLDNLTSGGASPLAPGETLANAQTRFDDLRAAALGGDSTARNDLAGAAQNLIGALEVNFGRTTQFFDGFNLVISTLETLLGDVPGFAHGTLSAPSGLALVGERGPELVRFRGGEQVIPNLFQAANDNMVPALFTVGRDIVTAIYRDTAASLDGDDRMVAELRMLREAFLDVSRELRELKSAQRTAQAPMRKAS